MKTFFLFKICWLCSNFISQAAVIPRVKYEYYTQGETVLLKCMSKANKADWVGPAQANMSGASPVDENDIYGKCRKWNTSLYATNQKVNPSLPHRNRLKIDGNEETGDFNLQIRNFSKNDEGLYICQYIDKNGNISTVLFVLQEKTYPSKMIFKNATKENVLNGVAHKDLNIKCSVESGKPPETLSLIRHNKTVKTGEHGNIEYTLKPTKLDHNVIYTCEAKSPLFIQPLRRNVRLNIKYKPIVSTIDQLTVEINEGAEKNICCYVESNPAPTTTRLLNGSQEIFVEQYAKDICYPIERVSRYDRGNYTYISENEIGSGSATMILKVKYPPDVHLDYKNFTINDEMRTIQCKAEGFPSNYKYGVWEHRSEFNEHIRYLKSTDSGTLILPRINEAAERYQDNGYYICMATNGVPNLQHFQQGKSYVISQGPPVFDIQNNAIVYGTTGKQMTMRIYISSYSKIECKILRSLDNDAYDFETNSKPLKVVNTFHGKNISVNGIEVSFIFERLEPKHFQLYKITVCNEFGNTSYTVNLVSTDANKTDGEKTISRNSAALVSCLFVLAAVILLMLVCIVKIRKKTNSGNLDEEQERVEGLGEPVENVMYQSAQQGQNVMQPSPVSTLLPGDDTISDIESSTRGTIRRSMESRLNYADVVFEPSSSQHEARIIGLEDRTVYADVDIALVAPSSPERRSDTSSSEDDFVYVDGIENYIEKRETND